MATIQDLPSGEALSSARPKIVSNFTALNTELGQKETPAGAQDKADAVAAYPRTKGGTYYAADYGQISSTLAVSHLAIQAAIDAAAVLGGTVVLPPQLCLLGASLVPRSNVTLLGSGSCFHTNETSWDMLGSYASVLRGSAISFPGGICIDQAITGSPLDQGFALEGFNIHDLIFVDSAGILRAGATDYKGLVGASITNVQGARITGTAFNLKNYMRLTVTGVAVSANRGWYLANDHATGSYGNSTFVDIFVIGYQSQSSYDGILLETTAHCTTPLNQNTFVRVQVNAMGSGGAMLSCIRLKKTANTSISGANLEATAAQGIWLDGECFGTTIFLSGSVYTNGKKAVRVTNSDSTVIYGASRANVIEIDDTFSAGYCYCYGIFDVVGSANKYPGGNYQTTANSSIVQLGTYDWQRIKMLDPYTIGFGGAVKFSFTGGAHPVFGSTTYSGASVTVAQNDGPTIYLTGTTQSVDNTSKANGYRRRFIKTSATGTATLTGIAGGNVTMTSQYCCVEIESDGTNWYLAHKHGT